MKNIINNKYFLFGLALVIGLAIGLLFSGKEEPANEQHVHGKERAEATTWTCSMHPQIKRSEPGDCPICGMELIPLADTSSEKGLAGAVQMTPTAMQLANVVTTKVGAKNEAKSIQLNGKVQENEQSLYRQTAHFPGRIEQLVVNFEGEYVQKGQVLAKVYAPALQTAQKELLEAKKFEATQPALFEAAKQKLKNWKLSDAQIDQLLERKEVQEIFPLQADYSGYVTQLNVNKGDYVEKGKVLYQLADLSQVWVMLDVYEGDLAYVNKGDEVSIKVSSFPTQKWTGKIDFIDPVINPNTRVASARVMLKNPNLQLKPEMLVTVQLKAKPKGAEVISIPKSAILWTGKRSVVYVKDQSTDGVYFRMREVSLGQSLGESYEITNGLTAGEVIATNGAFSIDAAAQLAGKPSMMNASQPDKVFEIEEEAKQEMQEVIKHYLSLKDALVQDQFPQAKAANEQLLKVLSGIPMSAFSAEAHKQWMPMQQSMVKASNGIQQAKNIETGRKEFIELSVRMIAMEKSFSPFEGTLYVQHCPMADSNKGADWLSTETEILNPYFGASMISCGEVVEEINNK